MKREQDVITVTMPDKTQREFPFEKRVWSLDDIHYDDVHEQYCIVATKGDGLSVEEVLTRLNYAEDLKCRAAARALAFPTKGKKAKCDWARAFITKPENKTYLDQYVAEGLPDSFLLELYDTENATVA